VYVGGTLTFDQFMDTNGAYWVQGNIVSNGSGARLTNYSAVYFDDTLNLPTLNVILLLGSWQEVTPSSTAWN
jgi:hypothetical protein